MHEYPNWSSASPDAIPVEDLLQDSGSTPKRIVIGVLIAALLGTALLLGGKHDGGRKKSGFKKAPPVARVEPAPAPSATRTAPPAAPAAAAQPPMIVQIDPPSVWLRDPVCGRVVDPQTATWVLEVGGQDVYFDSMTCLRRYCASLRQGRASRPQATGYTVPVVRDPRVTPAPPPAPRHKPKHGVPSSDAPSVEESPMGGDHPEIPKDGPVGPYSDTGGL